MFGDASGTPPAAGAGPWAALPPAGLADTIAARSITLLRDSSALLPLRAPRAVLALVYDGAGAPASGNATLEATLRAAGLTTTRRTISARNAAALVDSLARAWGADGAAAPVVVVASYSQAIPWAGRIGLPAPVAAALERLARRTPLVHVALGDPYVIRDVPSASTVLLAWSGMQTAQEAAARALLGTAAVSGRLPVDIPPAYRVGQGMTRALAGRESSVGRPPSRGDW